MFLHLFIYFAYVHACVQAQWHECGGLKTACGSQFPGMELLRLSGNHLASPKIGFSSLFLTSPLFSPSLPSLISLSSQWGQRTTWGAGDWISLCDTVVRLLGQWTSWDFASSFLPPSAEHWDQKHTLSCLASHGLWGSRALYPVRSSVCDHSATFPTLSSLPAPIASFKAVATM